MSESEADAAVGMLSDLAEQRHITLLIVEHNMRVMMRLAARITVMHQGEILAEGPPAAIRADPAVVEAYLGEDGGHA